MKIHHHLRALLQPCHHILLDLCHLDIRRELLDLVELAVRLGPQRLLVLALAEGEEGALLVAIGKSLARGIGLGLYENINTLLVLEEAVALDFEVEDGPARGGWLAYRVMQFGGRGGWDALVLLRDGPFALFAAHVRYRSVFAA